MKERKQREFVLTVPLSVIIPRKTKADKRWILNLNNYRNTNFIVLSLVKRMYAEVVLEALSRSEWDGMPFHCVDISLLYWHGRRGRVDKSNPCSIIEKFTCDALTKAGVWDDDNSEIMPVTEYVFMGIDKKNPRCEVIISERSIAGY